MTPLSHTTLEPHNLKFDDALSRNDARNMTVVFRFCYTPVHTIDAQSER